MSSQSKIEWTDATWNPVTGCTPISEGCDRCYAQRILHRFKRSKHVVCHESRLVEPGKWSPRRVFVCSMADLFHEDVPDAFIRKVYAVMMETAPNHIYQVLTKRPERLLSLWPALAPYGTNNIWHGVSMEHDGGIQRERLRALQGLAGTKRFISFEPLLESVYLTPDEWDGISWIIAGGETGAGARPMDADWVRGLRNMAIMRGIPFFFKQWGGRDKSAELDGRTWKELPKP